MAIAVSDALSNVDEQIVNASKVIGSSTRRQRVFERIYYGPKQFKTVDEIAKAAKLSNWDVLTVARKMLSHSIITKKKLNGKTAYGKVPFCASNKEKILDYARHPTKLRKISTKSKPRSQTNISIVHKGIKIKIAEVTCDDFDQFSAIRKVKVAVPRVISEKDFKYGIARLCGDSGTFTDWGGERNDLYTSKVRIKGKRKTVAFAFKGPGKPGKLTPGKLGKNGDQIQRLFESPAEIFIIQHHTQIDESVLAQMKKLAVANSAMESKEIWYGVVDGDDTNRLLSAYPKAFKLK